MQKLHFYPVLSSYWSLRTAMVKEFYSGSTYSYYQSLVYFPWSMTSIAIFYLMCQITAYLNSSLMITMILSSFESVLGSTPKVLWNLCCLLGQYLLLSWSFVVELFLLTYEMILEENWLQCQWSLFTLYVFVVKLLTYQAAESEVN